MYHSFLIHSSADGHLGSVHVLAIINSAAMYIEEHVSLSILVSSECMPSSGSPVQVQCMRQVAQGWCTGMTLKDGMGRELGGGIRMGSTCTPVADSC